jgi:Tfp pilus assembly protein PilN
MIKKTVNINLATHPARNRRLFLGLSGTGSILLILTAVVAINIFVTYSTKNEGVEQALNRLEERMKLIQREEKRISNRIEQIELADGARVDVYNDLIFQKSFSWVELLSALEKALPDACFIQSFSPLQKKENQLEVKFNIAYQSLDDLLGFIDRLNKMGFESIQVKNESQGGGKYDISEVSLSYERTH